MSFCAFAPPPCFTYRWKPFPVPATCCKKTSLCPLRRSFPWPKKTIRECLRPCGSCWGPTLARDCCPGLCVASEGGLGQGFAGDTSTEETGMVLETVRIKESFCQELSCVCQAKGKRRRLSLGESADGKCGPLLFI